MQLLPKYQSDYVEFARDGFVSSIKTMEHRWPYILHKRR